MKTLLAFLALFISVGAWGQTTAKTSACDGYLTGDGKCLIKLPPENSITLQAPNPHLCTCTFAADGSGMSCSPLKACAEIFRKGGDQDVPAIQDGTEKRKIDSDSSGMVVGCDVGFYLGVEEGTKKWACYRQRWSCADKTRTLMETLDGKTHYCHRPQLTSK